MKITIKLKLTIMMFLEYFVWGLWFVTLGTYIVNNLKANGNQVGMAFGTQSLGAIIAPFIIGLIADKYFSAQKILGTLHLAGALILFYITQQTNFQGFYSLILVYMILYMPTLGLVNSIVLNQVKDAEKEFGGIRVWGTIGWIAAGLLVGALSLEQKNILENTFKMASISALILGLFSFILPNTPPNNKNKKLNFRDIIGLDSLQLLKNKNYLVFFITSILICIPLAFYYQETNIFLNEIGVQKAAAKMSMGQMSETIFLFCLPLFFKYFDVKKMLLFGMCAWLLRYLLFSYGDTDSNIWMLYLGIILHGICYDFFFVTGQIYTDQKAPIQIRSSAQGMITIATYGIGMYVGFTIAGLISSNNVIGEILKNGNSLKIHNWKAIWQFPTILSFVFIVFFMLLFKTEKNNK